MQEQATNTTQKRLRILGDDEIQAVYGRPRFTDDERLEYFTLSATEKATLEQLHSIKSRIYFILPLGYKKKGHIHNGKQNHYCHDCVRQFVQCCEQYRIPDDTRALIERLLLERISLRGICRAVGVRLKWLLGFLVQCFEALPDHLHVQPVTCKHNVMIQRLEVEADEMASFVQKKANKQWIWIAMDATTRQVIAFYVADRSRRSAKRLRAKFPEAFRQHATFDTDQYVVYAGVIPVAQHRAISKLARKTNHIERFNSTLRQRVSRLVREALSFSKKLANHLGAIKLFICHYNLTRAAA